MWKECSVQKRKGDILELDFGQTPDISREEYLDVYEGIQSEILNITRFDENSDLSTTYLGKGQTDPNITSLKWGKSFANIRVREYLRKIIRWNRMPNIVRHRSQKILHVKILPYVHCKSLHSLPKFCIKNTENSGRQWSTC